MIFFALVVKKGARDRGRASLHSPPVPRVRPPAPWLLPLQARDGGLYRQCCGARIAGLPDRTADDDVIGTISEGRRHIDRALLVVAARSGADARTHDQRLRPQFRAQARRFQTGADQSCGTGCDRVARAQRHGFIERPINPAGLEFIATDAGQHGHRQQLRATRHRRRHADRRRVRVHGEQIWLVPRDAAVAAKAQAAGGFTRGAAKDEVIAVQGTPTKISRAGHETWTYGSATQIDFDGAGRVTGWTESDVKLKLR